MGTSEPSLIPEWLKSNGNATGNGRTAHNYASPTPHTDERSLANYSRNKSLRSIGESDSPRPLLDRPTSFTYRSSGIIKVTPKNPYSSFSRSHRDRDRDGQKERSDFGELWESDCFDPLGKDTFRRSRSLVSRRKQGLVPRRVASDFTNNDKSNQTFRNGLHDENISSSIFKKSEFHKEFPTLSVDENQEMSDIARVASPILTVASPGLPIGSSALVGEGWSALAEVPALVGAGTEGLPHGHHPSDASSNPDYELNMAEKLALSPLNSDIAPQVSTESQKHEQMAVKQSRQLIPMTPAMPKPMVSISANKFKAKTAIRNGELHNTSKSVLQSSPYLSCQSPGGAQGMLDSSKASQVGRFYVLKPPWENTATTALKDDSAFAHDVGNKCLDNLATLKASAALSRNSNSSGVVNIERKSVASNLSAPSVVEKKRMLSHARSRNEFFNSVRKKTSMTSPLCSEASSTTSHSAGDSQKVVMAISNGVDLSNLNGCVHEEEMKSPIKETNTLSPIEVISDEEEAAFLRSLGWDENCNEDDGLTEEEINTFYQEVMKLRPT